MNFRCGAVLEGETTSLSAAASISARGRPWTKSIAAAIRALSSPMSGSVSPNVRGSATGQQRAGNDRVPIGLRRPAAQAVHVGIEPHVEKDGGIDLSRLGMGRGLVEQTGQIAEIRHEHADGSFVERDGHDFDFSGWHHRDIWSKWRHRSRAVI